MFVPLIKIFVVGMEPYKETDVRIYPTSCETIPGGHLFQANLEMSSEGRRCVLPFSVTWQGPQLPLFHRAHVFMRYGMAAIRVNIHLYRVVGREIETTMSDFITEDQAVKGLFLIDNLEGNDLDRLQRFKLPRRENLLN